MLQIRVVVSALIQIQLFTSMLIRIQGAKPMGIHADTDPGLGQTFSVTKWDFEFQNIPYFIMLVLCHKKYLRCYKSHLKRLEVRLVVNFGQFPWSWIRIRFRIPNTLKV